MIIRVPFILLLCVFTSLVFGQTSHPPSNNHPYPDVAWHEPDLKRTEVEQPSSDKPGQPVLFYYHLLRSPDLAAEPAIKNDLLKGETDFSGAALRYNLLKPSINNFNYRKIQLDHNIHRMLQDVIGNIMESLLMLNTQTFHHFGVIPTMPPHDLIDID